MNRLLYLAISNLACFDTLVIRPEDSSLLLGPNGSGKSTLFDILFGLRTFINLGVEAEKAFPAYQVRQTPGTPAGIDLVATSGKSVFRYELYLGQLGARRPDSRSGLAAWAWVIRSEELLLNSARLTSFKDWNFEGVGIEGTVPLSGDRSPLATMRFPQKSGVEVFKAWTDGIWLLRLEPRQMLASAHEGEDRLDVSGKNFVAWLLGFNEREESLDRVIRSVGMSIEGLKGLSLDLEGRSWVLVAHFESGARVDFNGLSDGQRCLIVLHAVLVLAKRHCTLLLLDEPDAHVTPTEILPLLSTIREQVESNGIQVLVASHHPQVIDALAAESPWEMVVRDGRIRAEPYLVDSSTGVSASRHLLLRGRQ